MQETPQQQDRAARLARIEGYLAADPANPELLACAMELCLAHEDMERACHHAEQARLRHPDDLSLQYRRGHVLVALGQWRDAAALFAGLLAINPDPSLAFSLANCQLHEGQYGVAHDTMAPYSDAPGLPHQGATLLVRALHHLGKYGAGAALIESFQGRFLDQADFCAAASLLYVDAGLTTDAALMAERALAGGARPVEALVASGTLALGSTDAALASLRFTEALTHNPAEGRCWSGLGMATMLRRDMAGAIPQLEQAVRFMPVHIGSWHALGWCQLLTQDLDGAADAFRAALKLDRNFGESHGVMAVVAALRGQRALAEETIKTALRLDASSLAARYAQMLLSGEAADPERFKRIVLRMIGAYDTLDGESLSAVVERMTAH